MADGVEVQFTPRDLMRRMRQYPTKLDKVLKETNKASLLTLWEKVPAYPRRPNSRYKRTGTLGRSLGASKSGGKIGQPDILSQKKLGTSGYEGAFGSNLSYAADVIGEGTQKPIHQGIWWTITTVLKRARAKIVRLHETTAEEMTAFLDGKGT